MSLRTSFGLLVAAACVLALPMPASARELRADVPIEITADQIVYEQARQVYVAEGSVRVVQDDRQIDADWMVFNRRTGRGIAAGRVRAVDSDNVLEARFIEFDNATQEGLVLTGRLDLGEEDFRVAAGELVRLDESRYEVRDLSMTTCRCPDDNDRLPWVINADKGDLTIGGYATVTNATVDVLGIPMVWLPWAAVPVKTERATGFLPPQIGFGGGLGFEAALPFFWAARDNVNVTLTPRYLTERGFKPELLIETVYGEKSSSEIFVSYLRDQDPDKVRLVPPRVATPREKNVYDPDRWALGFDNDIHAPLGLRLRSDIQLISDNQYIRDFGDFREQRKDRFLESVAFGFAHAGSDGSAGGVVSVRYRDDQQNPDNVDRDKYLLHRAPGAELAWLPTRVESLAGIEFGVDVDYVHFYPYKRAENVLDLTSTSGGVIGKDQFLDIGIASIVDAIGDQPEDQADRQSLGIDDGVFQEGEPLADRGHRILFNPHLGHSFRVLDLFDVRPELGWHQTLYSTSAQSFNQRGMLTGRVDIQSQLRGSLEAPLLPPLLHLLEPRLSWAYVQSTSQGRNPLFVPATKVPQQRIRQLSLDNVVLDDADRIDSANVLSAGFGNHFYLKQGRRARLFAELDLSVAYDFSGSGDWGLAIAEGRLLPWKRMTSTFNFAYDIDENRVEEGLFDVSLSLAEVLGLKRSSRLRLGYRYRQSVGLFFENFEQIEGVADLDGDLGKFSTRFTRINQVTGGTRLRLTPQWALDYQVAYSLHQSKVLTNRGAIEYTSKCRCWAVQVMAQQRRTQGFRLGVNIRLLGFGMNLDEPFQGGIGVGSGMF